MILLIPVLAIAQTADDYFNKGATKAEKGDYTGAINDYNKAIELDPNYAKAYYNRGGDKLKLGNSRGAIQDKNKDIELNHNYATEFYNRCTAKVKMMQKNYKHNNYINTKDIDNSYVNA